MFFFDQISFPLTKHTRVITKDSKLTFQRTAKTSSVMVDVKLEMVSVEKYFKS